jgi:hypothetical protein
MNIACMGSMPYEKGSAIAMESMPPNPGRSPNTAPMRAPIRREIIPIGSISLAAAKAILSNIVDSALKRNTPLTHGEERGFAGTRFFGQLTPPQVSQRGIRVNSPLPRYHKGG